MNDTLKIPQSKGQATFGLVLCIGLISFLSYQWYETRNDIKAVYFWLPFIIFLMVFLLYFVFKFFIPSMKGLAGLTLDNDGITDNIRHRKVKWNNVTGIRMTSSGSSTGMAVDIIDKNKIEESKSVYNYISSKLGELFYSTPLIISNKFLKGDDKEIFADVLMFFERIKNCS
jgi:hypothetical protein